MTRSDYNAKFSYGDAKGEDCCGTCDNCSKHRRIAGLPGPTYDCKEIISQVGGHWSHMVNPNCICDLHTKKLKG
jgi:hypothetical protein